MRGLPRDRIVIDDLGPGDVALLRDMAEAPAEHAVKRMFIAMGLDPSKPLDAQQDCAVLRNISLNQRADDHVADMTWVRSTRVLMQSIVGKIVLTSIAIGVLGTAHAVWAGVRTLIK